MHKRHLWLLVFTMLGCGNEDVVRQVPQEIPFRQMRISVTSESDFLASTSDMWQQIAAGVYVHHEDGVRYQVAFGKTGFSVAAELVQQEYADLMNNPKRGETAETKADRERRLLQALQFWKAVNEEQALKPDVAEETLSSSAIGCHGGCTVSASAYVAPGEYCAASATAVYSGIFSPGYAGRAAASAGAEHQEAWSSTASAGAQTFEIPCTAFAAAQMADVAVTASP